MVGQFVEGIAYIRDHRNVGWSLSYLGITGALVGVLGVLGPGFAKTTLALGEKDFALIVLPLGLGIVTGILVLNSYGRYLPRRRTIEAGMVGMGAAPRPSLVRRPDLALPRGPGHLHRPDRGQPRRVAPVAGHGHRLPGRLPPTSVVAISVQTQLQEELPEEVRGRVFGVLNMLVSIASLAPIIVVGPVADVVGVPVGHPGRRHPSSALWGLASVIGRGALAPAEASARAPTTPSGAPGRPADRRPVSGRSRSWTRERHRRRSA